MTLAGLLSAAYYIKPDLLFGVLHFNIAKILHIDTLIIWLLMDFMGAVALGWTKPSRPSRGSFALRCWNKRRPQQH